MPFSQCMQGSVHLSRIVWVVQQLHFHTDPPGLSSLSAVKCCRPEMAPCGVVRYPIRYLLSLIGLHSNLSPLVLHLWWVKMWCKVIFFQGEITERYFYWTVSLNEVVYFDVISRADNDGLGIHPSTDLSAYWHQDVRYDHPSHQRRAQDVQQHFVTPRQHWHENFTMQGAKHYRVLAPALHWDL